jgi:hypothetical protein
MVHSNAQDDPGQPGRCARDIEVGQHRQAKENENGSDSDRQFQTRVDAQRMQASRHQPGKQEAARAHAAHEGAQQHS